MTENSQPRPAVDTRYRPFSKQKLSPLAEAANRKGAELCAAGDLRGGAEAIREAVRIDPDCAEYQLNLGSILNALGEHGEAKSVLFRARELAPGQADIHKALARACSALGQAEELARDYLKACKDKPGDLVLARNAILVLLQLRRPAEAAALARTLAAAAPEEVEPRLLLAECLSASGQMGECESVLTEALRLKPGHARANFQLGNVQLALGNYEAAAASLEAVLSAAPDHVEALLALGFAKLTMGQVNQAISLCQGALNRQPKLAAAHRLLAWALAQSGNMDEAAARYRTALALAPDDKGLRSNFVYALSLQPSATRAQIWEAHREWDRRHGGLPAPAHDNARDPGRRLRLGYVSGDFREHSVMYFLEPLLKAHAKKEFEIFCYADGARFDAATERLKKLSNHWRMTAGASDEELARQIRQDGIDILVDLAGHTGSNRLGVFARKPSPVAVSWLGYPETTGLAAMDYKISDAFVSPPGEAERFASEKFLRLDEGFHCYQPAADWPEIAPPPHAAAGHVTFGSFADLHKVNPQIALVWAKLLRAVPASKLVIKCGQFADEAMREKYTGIFRDAGVASDRLVLMGRSANVARHVALYRLMDIGLDTFPYSGTTTICEALWMGVPVVSLAGERPASRVGGSILRQAGLADLVAANEEEFVAIAARLAANLPALAQMRAGMRARLGKSSLRDEAGFAKKIENAYRTAWQNWCHRRT